MNNTGPGYQQSRFRSRAGIGTVVVCALFCWLCAGCAGTDSALRLGAEDARAGLAIVLPADAPVQADFAATELQKYLSRVFGAEFTIQRGGEPIRPAIILEPVPAGPPSTLGEEGYRIRTERGMLTITGGLPRGIIYGVYAFLENQFGCRWLAPDCEVIPARGTVTLRDLDETYVPPLPYRDTNHWSARDVDWSLHQRLNGARACLGEPLYDPPRGWTDRYASLTFNVMDKYFDQHPEYFAIVDGERTTQGQLCFTDPEMRRVFLDVVLAQLRKQPVRILSVPQRERGEGGGRRSYCHCDRCQAVATREGSQSGPLLEFINYLAAAVTREFPDTYIQTEAYQWSLEPPAHLHAHPHVIVQLCPIGCAYNHPLDHPLNAAFQRQIKGWGEKCDHLFIWDYTINFWHLLAPHPNFRVLAPNIRFFLQHNVTGVFEQGNNFHPATEFTELRAYLIARALWNPQTDTEKDIDEFVAGYYGPAGPFIRQYITRAHETVQDPAFHMGIYNGCTCDSEACRENRQLPPRWPPALLHEFVALFDSAEQAVAEDPVRLRRVERARLPLFYKQISGEYMNNGAGVDHDPAMTHAALGQLIERFETIARREGATRACEFDSDNTGTLDAYLQHLKDWYVKQPAIRVPGERQQPGDQ